MDRVRLPGRPLPRPILEKKFNGSCLSEYAEVFPAVGGDFSFYRFYDADFWQRLFSQVPPSFQFGLKVPQEITTKVWPGLRRHGVHAGKTNSSFLDADLLQREFLGLLTPHRHQVGAPMLFFRTSWSPTVLLSSVWSADPGTDNGLEVHVQRVGPWYRCRGVRIASQDQQRHQVSRSDHATLVHGWMAIRVSHHRRPRKSFRESWERLTTAQTYLAPGLLHRTPCRFMCAFTFRHRLEVRHVRSYLSIDENAGNTAA